MRLNSTLVLVFLCGSTLGAEEATQRKAPPESAAINAAMQEFVEAKEIAGAVTLVARKGKVLHFSAVGSSDLERGRELKRFHLFAIASMTKPIAATALMILQDEGKLSVDDPVSKYVPALANVKLKDGSAPKRPITIRDCLTHTAGFSGSQGVRDSLESAVNALADRPLAFSPGEKWQYSPGLNVVGRIVEVVSEKPFEEFLQQRIFTPLEMKQTTFYPQGRQLNRVAKLYEQNETKTALVPAESFLGDYAAIKAPSPSGGLFSTARDMQRFYQMILRGGKWRDQRIVSRKAVKAMTTLQTGTLKTGFTPGNGWGLGWCVVQDPQGTTGMLSKGTFGHGGAYGTQGWVDPETKTVYVLMIQRKGLANSDDSPIRKAFQVAASQLEAL